MVEITQWAGMLFLIAFYPIQNWRLLVRGDEPVGLSFTAFGFLAVGVAGYFMLGVYLGLLALAFGNFINLVLLSALMLIIWRRSSALTFGERFVGLLTLFGGLLFLAYVYFFFPLQTSINIVGWVGLVGIVAFFLIQNSTLLIRRDPTGLSLSAFSFLAVGLVLYTILGFLVDDLRIILGNGFSFLGTLIIIVIIIKGFKKTA